MRPNDDVCVVSCADALDEGMCELNVVVARNTECRYRLIRWPGTFLISDS
jgi:hypothetical protein